MGDFERTFGAGADAVDLIEGLCAGQSRGWGLEAYRSAPAPDYDEDGLEVNPMGLPRARLVVFTSYAQLARWDALGLRLAFRRSRGEGAGFEMVMIGRRPAQG